MSSFALGERFNLSSRPTPTIFEPSIQPSRSFTCDPLAVGEVLGVFKRA
jgi:hypothetical protein